MTNNKLFYRILFIFTLTLISAVFSFAQTENKQLRIGGKVMDQNRAVIAGAKVNITAKGGVGNFTTVTDQNGEFSLSVQPGEYLLEIEANGFERASQIVNLRSGNADALEITLPVEGTKAT